MKKDNQILKRFFSKTTFDQLWLSGKSKVFDYTVRQFIDNPYGIVYLDLVKKIYDYMGKQYRTEYYYKNKLLNKLLFQRHNYKTTVALTELPVADSKADFLLINGKGTVYEIKTELDNLKRLASQINDYYKAFSDVYVVTFHDNIKKVKAILPIQTGIIELTERNALKTVRKASEVTSNFDYDTIIRILRKKEFENILRNNHIDLPDVDQFHYYQACYEDLKTIDILKLQKLMLKTLKERENKLTSQRSYQLAEELRFILYFDNNKKLTTDRIINTMERKYEG